MRISEITEQGYGSAGKNAVTGKVKRVTGQKVTVADPENPGVETDIDLTKTDLDFDPKTGSAEVNLNKKSMGQKKTPNLRPNSKITINRQ